MKRGQVEGAKRRALVIFDEWARVTGFVDGTSYRYEIEGLIEDAVECGAQAALGIHERLESEQLQAEIIAEEVESARLRDSLPA